MNTYAEAAKKMGIPVSTVMDMKKRRVIKVIEFNKRTIRITDAEIQRVIEKRTRKAVV